MKDLLESLSTVVWVALILALCFIFYGTPDLWDKWHAQAMGQCPPPSATNGRDEP